MSNLNRKSSEVSWIRENFIIVLVSIALLIVSIFSIKMLITSFNATQKGMEVNNLYLSALHYRSEWVRSTDPRGKGGVHPPTAKKKADEAFLELKRVVENLPPGEIPLRVKEFIAYGPIQPYVEASRK
jgi:hypothetical protein